ncbi:hypothetical protein [Kocuria rhizophila]|uniref:hypothetical protein n=2 Tax=Kocuria rhizophila TaxID=72000 RepID=UPI001EF5FEF5|nr:hypothetical protein [Kocuria rhizophila]MCG7424311.1 hypothetical protein [Kocuria rhizophila]MCT1456067.1 hypothetical protein [Kocuria rhizophila]
MGTIVAALVGVLAGVGACMAMGRWPKASCVVLLIMTLLSQTLATVSGVSLLGNVDEIAVALALLVFSARRLVLHGSLRCLGAYWFFGAFFALGLVSSVINTVPLSVWGLGAFLILKGPLLALGVMQLDWCREDLRPAAWVATAILVLILLSAVLNAAAPEAWNSVVGRAPVSYRLGIPSLTGVFDHPVGLGSTMGMAFLAVLAYHRIIARSVWTYGLLVATGLAGLLTFRRKSVASTALVAVVGRLWLPGLKAKAAATIAILVPAALIVGWEPLTQVITTSYHEYFDNVGVTARTLMTIDSVKLAAAAFPLGVGFGRFGSAVASSTYSPLYVDLGYQRVYGMGEGARGGFLTDTFWPSVLAETGALGMLCYVTALVLLMLPAWRLMRRHAHPHVRWLGAVAVSWMAQMFIESLAAPVFTGPPMFGPVFMVVGIAAAVYLRESSGGGLAPAVLEMAPAVQGEAPWARSASATTPGGLAGSGAVLPEQSDDCLPSRATRCEDSTSRVPSAPHQQDEGETS